MPVSWSSRAAISRDHAAPVLFVLVVARFGQAAVQGQDQRHGVLGDRLRVHAGGAGEADAVRAQHVLVVHVDAGADRLDELELLGDARQLVLPQHGDHEHIRFRQLPEQLFRRAHLDVGDARIAQREALGQAVGAMGKANLEAVFGGQHLASILEHTQREVAQQQLLVAPALAHALQAPN